MILGVVTQVGRYCAPRSRSSKWCLYLVLSLLLMGVVSYKSGFLHYFLVAQVLKRRHYSMQELSDMIPHETNVKVSIRLTDVLCFDYPSVYCRNYKTNLQSGWLASERDLTLNLKISSVVNL